VNQSDLDRGENDPAEAAADFLAALASRVERWPLPLAHPAQQCLEWAGAPASLVNWSFQLYGQSLRLPALYLTGAYLASEVARTDLNTALQEDLRRPLLGKWRGFLRDAIDRLVNSGLDTALVRAVRDFHAEIGARSDAPASPTLRDGQLVRKKTTVLDAILEMRNDLAHGARGLDEDVAANLLASLSPLMTRLVEALDCLDGFKLIAQSLQGQETLLHGPTPPALAADHHCALIGPDGTRIPLRPLALVDLLGDALQQAATVDLLLYDGRQDKRLRYLGLQEAHERKDAFSDFSLALERKAVAARLQDPVASWDHSRLREALALRQFQFEADGRAPVAPEMPISRPALEERLDSFFRSGAPAILLTGPPGAGRSALLARTTRRLLAEGVPAACFAAGMLAPLLSYGSMEEILPEVLFVNAQFADLLRVARLAKRPGLVIAIDALESGGDAGAIRHLLHEVEQLCRQYRGSPFKLLLSIQSHVLARVLEDADPLDESVWFHTMVAGPEGERYSAPELPVEELEPDEAESLYHALCAAAGEAAPRTPWNMLPDTVRERLRLPAFTHRFVSVMGGQYIRSEEILTGVERAFCERTLFGRRYDPRRRAYVDAFPGRKRQIEQVARQLIDKRTSSVDIASLEPLGEEYLEVLDSGLLQEFFDPARECVAVRFASPAAFAAVARDLFIRDRSLFEQILFGDDLGAACNTIPGLEATLVEVAARELERSEVLAAPLMADRDSPIRRELLAGVLLQLGQSDRGALDRLLDTLIRSYPEDDVQEIVVLALGEGKLFSRPDAAGVLSQAALARLAAPRNDVLLLLSRALRRTGATEKAEQALRIKPHDAVPQTESNRLYYLASLLRDSGRWAEALPLLAEAKAGYRAVGNKDGLLRASASIAETLSLLNRHEEAARELDSAESEGAGAGAEAELVFRVKHALSLRMRGLLRKAYSRCEEVVRRAASARMLHLAARAQTEMGIIHALLDDPAGAAVLLEQAIVTKTHLGDNHGLKQAYLCLGFAHATAGKVADARAAYEQSLSLNRETSDIYGELLCLELLLRLDPALVNEPALMHAVALANRAAGWKNPQIQHILEMFQKRLTTAGAD
jgi:tetratricopeptide (TPR) repeat protein